MKTKKSVTIVLNHAEQQCKAAGARLTLKRRQVLSGLLESEKALSAYELVDVCKEAHGEVLPAMSVYRILDFLEAHGLVHKLKLANKYVACSHITCDHDHEVPQFLICNRCQLVEEISVNKDVINSLKNNVGEAGFQLNSPQLEMDCICQRCLSGAA